MTITRSARKIQLSALHLRLSFFCFIFYFLPSVNLISESLFPVCIFMITESVRMLPFRQLTILPEWLTLL